MNAKAMKLPLLLLTLCSAALLLSCRGLHGIPDKTAGGHAITLWAKGAQASQEQATEVRLSVKRRLKYVTGAGMQELSCRQLDSFQVGSVKYLVIPDSVVYPFRPVSPFYKVERSLSANTLLLSNKTTVFSGPGSASSSVGTAAGISAAALYATRNNSFSDGAIIGAALGTGITLGLVEVFMHRILVWPTHEVRYEYNTHTKNIRVLKD